MNVEGFVTIGRGELLLSLLAVALLCVLAGFLGGQLSKMIRRPAPIKFRPITPEDEERGRKMLREMCPGPHCDDDKQLTAWLRSKDYSLITNEMLTEMKRDAEEVHRRIDAVEFKTRPQPQWRSGPDAVRDADGADWPGGDPDAV